MPTVWQIGDEIERRWKIYKILQGGAGIVYIVYDHQFGEPFAAKTFQDEIFECNPDIAPRFTQEALAWINLDAHPNITRARMVERIEGKPFLFLEYVSGGDLGAWIGTPRLTEDLPQVLRFAIHFCDGMTHAMLKGIRVHRDVKPRNCLITQDGTLKVTDFGLAKLLEDNNRGDGQSTQRANQNFSLTASGVGTCTHMAPEQFDDAKRVDVRADIYSFGVMLYQMLTGELPFVGQSWNELERLHKTQEPPRLNDADPRLSKVIRTCLEKEPRRRFANFEHVRDLLGEVYEGLVGSPAPQPAQGTELTSAEWNNKGSSLDNLGRHEEAIASYNHALQLNPQFVAAWFNKGVALYALRRVEEAVACYDQALRLNQASEQAWSNKGVALKALGRTQEAIICYDRALGLNPRYANAWVNKGVALRALGKTQDALTHCERAIQLNPSDENAWSNKGNALYSLRRQEEAIACYERALELSPRLEMTWLNKGMALMALGRFEEALTSYDMALSINPGLEQAWLYKGSALVNGFQRYREALAYFGEAERLGMREAEQGLALCRQKLGEQ